MGKNKKPSVAPKNIQAFERINFLHQAATLMSTIQYNGGANEKQSAYRKTKVKKWKGDPTGTLLGPTRHFNDTIKSMSRRLVLRLDPSVKRTICKRCDTALMPAITSTTRIRSKPVTTMVTSCNVCDAKKRFVVSEKHELFNDREDVVVHVE
ncbi:Rpr2-domain-containing protein [Backusella circina FSU 941]|nr:Rpr2-domain-containing protein [Backusella circina FSU 941]